MKKRFFSILLSICMVLMLFPVTAFAKDEPPYTVTYKSEHGTLPEDWPNPERIDENTAIVLPDLEECGAFQLLGWQIEGFDDTTIYEVGEEYYPSENMTFVAVYDEIITLTVPFTTTVKLGDTGVPGETTFDLAIVAANAGEERYADVTVSGSVTTNGAGSYTGTMSFTGPFQQLRNMLCEGAFVQQVNAGVEGWTYDDTVWGLLLNDVIAMAPTDDALPTYTVLVLPASCNETANGIGYELEWNADPLKQMSFTNTYTKSTTESTVQTDPTDPKKPPKPAKPADSDNTLETDKAAESSNTNTTEPTTTTENNTSLGSTTSPKTGDSSNLTLWITILVASAAVMIGTGVYSKRKRCC